MVLLNVVSEVCVVVLVWVMCVCLVRMFGKFYDNSGLMLNVKELDLCIVLLWKKLFDLFSEMCG